MLGGAFVHKKIDKISAFRNLLIYIVIVFTSVSLSSIRIFNNNFVFIVPFVLFCFMNNKFYGYIAFLSSFFVLGNYSNWFYLSYLLVILSMFGFRLFAIRDRFRLKNVISFSSFFIVFIESFVTLCVYRTNDYFMMFLLSVASYWIMRYFYDLYINLHVRENKCFSPFLSVFVLSLLGVSSLGLNMNFGWFNLSLVVVVFLVFVGSKISLETGVLYSFIMLIMFKLLDIDLDNLLFLSACLIVFLLNKTSRLTLLFTYTLIVFSYLYYKEVGYLLGVNYFFGSLCFVLVPDRALKYFGEMSYGSDKYIEKINKENRRFNLEISNKILKMEEVFSLVSSKLNVKSRLKKCEKELLIEEIDIFDGLLKNFACEVRDSLKFNCCEKIEKELYKYGYDLLCLDIKENVFKDLIIDMNVRCDKKDIYKIINPLISGVMKKNFSVCKIKVNDIFDYYEVSFKEVTSYKFKYGVKQRAKDKEVCGDSYLVYENDFKIIYALSDGMGIGRQAKEKSKLTLDLFKKFMDIGFEEEKAVNSINCILKSEYNKDSYATLDLFIYDKYKKEFFFCKNGACDSFIIRNKEIINVEGDRLPVGIVDKIEVSKKSVKINKDDCVVMVSDGVSYGKINKIKNIKIEDPISISNEILKDSKDINDDESVIVIKIK